MAAANQIGDRTTFEAEAKSLETRIRLGEEQHHKSEISLRQTELSLREQQNEASILRRQLADSEAESREQEIRNNVERDVRRTNDSRNVRLQSDALARVHGEGQTSGEQLAREEVERNMAVFRQTQVEEMRLQLESQTCKCFPYSTSV